MWLRVATDTWSFGQIVLSLPKRAPVKGKAGSTWLLPPRDTRRIGNRLARGECLSRVIKAWDALTPNSFSRGRFSGRTVENPRAVGGVTATVLDNIRREGKRHPVSAAGGAFCLLLGISPETNRLVAKGILHLLTFEVKWATLTEVASPE